MITLQPTQDTAEPGLGFEVAQGDLRVLRRTGWSEVSMGGRAVGAGPGAAPALSAGFSPCLLSAQSALSKYACSCGRSERVHV